MKILNLGLDNSILNKNSKLANRAIEYGNLVDKYLVITPSKENKVLELSVRTVIYGVKFGNKIFGLFKIYNLAKKIIKEEKIDVISVQDQYYLGLIGFLLAKKFNKGLEIQIHGFEKYYGARKIIAKYILSYANTVRCVSQRLKRQLIEKFGVKEERITMVPIYSDLRFKIKDLRFKKDDKFVFLTVGRLVPVKNIGMQIEAMAEISKKLEVKSKNLELWIVGDGPERKKLEVRSKKLEVFDKIKFFGWQDDLEKFYSQADAFLLTSNYEGWGLAVIEAAAWGLPIVMTDVGCAGEVIKNGESGIVIPAGDKEKFNLAMIELIKDESLRKKLGDNAREAVKKLPDKEETLALYKKSWELAKI